MGKLLDALNRGRVEGTTPPPGLPSAPESIARGVEDSLAQIESRAGGNVTRFHLIRDRARARKEKRDRVTREFQKEDFLRLIGSIGQDTLDFKSKAISLIPKDDMFKQRIREEEAVLEKVKRFDLQRVYDVGTDFIPGRGLSREESLTLESAHRRQRVADIRSLGVGLNSFLSSLSNIDLGIDDEVIEFIMGNMAQAEMMLGGMSRKEADVASKSIIKNIARQIGGEDGIGISELSRFMRSDLQSMVDNKPRSLASLNGAEDAIANITGLLGGEVVKFTAGSAVIRTGLGSARILGAAGAAKGLKSIVPAAATEGMGPLLRTVALRMGAEAAEFGALEAGIGFTSQEGADHGRFRTAAHRAAWGAAFGGAFGAFGYGTAKKEIFDNLTAKVIDSIRLDPLASIAKTPAARAAVREIGGSEVIRLRGTARRFKESLAKEKRGEAFGKDFSKEVEAGIDDILSGAGDKARVKIIKLEERLSKAKDEPAKRKIEKEIDETRGSLTLTGEDVSLRLKRDGKTVSSGEIGSGVGPRAVTRAIEGGGPNLKSPPTGTSVEVGRIGEGASVPRPGPIRRVRRFEGPEPEGVRKLRPTEESRIFDELLEKHMEVKKGEKWVRQRLEADGPVSKITKQEWLVSLTTDERAALNVVARNTAVRSERAQAKYLGKIVEDAFRNSESPTVGSVVARLDKSMRDSQAFTSGQRKAIQDRLSGVVTENPGLIEVFQDGRAIDLIVGKAMSRAQGQNLTGEQIVESVVSEVGTAMSQSRQFTPGFVNDYTASLRDNLTRNVALFDEFGRSAFNSMRRSTIAIPLRDRNSLLSGISKLREKMIYESVPAEIRVFKGGQSGEALIPKSAALGDPIPGGGHTMPHPETERLVNLLKGGNPVQTGAESIGAGRSAIRKIARQRALEKGVSELEPLVDDFDRIFRQQQEVAAMSKGETTALLTANVNTQSRALQKVRAAQESNRYDEALDSIIKGEFPSKPTEKDIQRIVNSGERVILSDTLSITEEGLVQNRPWTSVKRQVRESFRAFIDTPSKVMASSFDEQIKALSGNVISLQRLSATEKLSSLGVQRLKAAERKLADLYQFGHTGEEIANRMFFAPFHKSQAAEEAEIAAVEIMLNGVARTRKKLPQFGTEAHSIEVPFLELEGGGRIEGVFRRAKKNRKIKSEKEHSELLFEAAEGNAKARADPRLTDDDKAAISAWEYLRDLYADKLGIEPGKRMEYYMHHIVEGGDRMSTALEALNSGGELAKLVNARNYFFGALLKRRGAREQKDFFRSIQVYLDRAIPTVHRRKALKEVLPRLGHLRGGVRQDPETVKALAQLSVGKIPKGKKGKIGLLSDRELMEAVLRNFVSTRGPKERFLDGILMGAEDVVRDLAQISGLTVSSTRAARELGLIGKITKRNETIARAKQRGELPEDTIVPVGERTFSPGVTRRGARATTRAIFAELLGGAVDSSVKNMTQLAFTVADEGLLPTIRGGRDFVFNPRPGAGRPASEALAAVGEVGDALSFRQLGRFTRAERFPSAVKTYHIASDWTPSSVWPSKMDKFFNGMEDALLSPFQFAEHFNRGITLNAAISNASRVRGVKYHELDPSIPADRVLINDIWDKAYSSVSNNQFAYSSVDMNPYFFNPIMRPFVQFMSYPVKWKERLFVDFMRSENDGFFLSLIPEMEGVPVARELVSGFKNVASKKIVRYFAFAGGMTAIAAKNGINLNAVYGAGVLPSGLAPAPGTAFLGAQALANAGSGRPDPRQVEEFKRRIGRHSGGLTMIDPIALTEFLAQKSVGELAATSGNKLLDQFGIEPLFDETPGALPEASDIVATRYIRKALKIIEAKKKGGRRSVKGRLVNEPSAKEDVLSLLGLPTYFDEDSLIESQLMKLRKEVEPGRKTIETGLEIRRDADASKRSINAREDRFFRQVASPLHNLNGKALAPLIRGMLIENSGHRSNGRKDLVANISKQEVKALGYTIDVRNFVNMKTAQRDVMKRDKPAEFRELQDKKRSQDIRAQEGLILFEKILKQEAAKIQQGAR